MPHYTTWGGTYVTRPVAIEDRDYSDNDYDINDIAIQSKQVDGITGIKSAAQGIRAEAAGATYLTDSIAGTAGPVGSTFRTDAGFAYAEEDVDGYFKLGDIKGEAIKAGIEPDFQPEVGRLRTKTTEARFSDIVGDCMAGIRDTDIASESLIDDMMTGVRDVGGTAGPGGSTFRDGEDDNIVVIHPTFRPVDDVDGVSDQCPQLRGEVEWTYFTDNVGSTAGPGGSTFTTGYDEAVGLDGYMVCPEPQWFMNNVGGSASPGGDDI